MPTEQAHLQEQADIAIVDHGACAVCTDGRWLVWHNGPCPEVTDEDR
jgi:hypothetical protein